MNAAKHHAFTLIELLIVVAIIAILAAIAVPNLIAAQVRSKVSRAKADMATLRTALEAYAVDESTYPLNAGGVGLSGALEKLTWPREYITTLPNDPFRTTPAGYTYIAAGKVTDIQQEHFGSYTLASVGPDTEPNTTLSTTVVYDPTNGLTSRGDVVYAHKSADEPVIARAPLTP